MFEFEKLKRKYDNLIKNELAINKQIIIDSFIEYYGSEFKNIIEQRYDKTIFVYYINWPSIEMSINEIIPKYFNQDKYSCFYDLIKYINKNNYKFIQIFKNKRLQDLPNNYIGSTNDKIFYSQFLKEKLLKRILSYLPSSGCVSDENLDINVICFPILIMNELVIIHEISHSLTKSILGQIISDDNHITDLVVKQGVAIDHNKERIFEELLNEKTALDVTRIFKNKGGSFTSFCYDMPFFSPYDYNLYLIDEFYEKFKNCIKIAKITDNKNYLVNKIGKDNYYKYIELVNKYYSQDIETINKIKPKALSEIYELLNSIERNITTSNEISNEELKLYYNNLIKQECKYNLLDRYNSDDMEQLKSLKKVKMK